MFLPCQYFANLVSFQSIAVGIRRKSFTFSYSVGVRHLRTVTSQKPYGGNIIAKIVDFRSDVEF